MLPPSKSPAVVQDVRPTPAVAKQEKRRPPPGSTQQSLAFELPAAAAAKPYPAKSTAPGIAHRLWLAVYLPFLPLDAVTNTDSAGAFAVTEERHGIRKVLLANAAATAAGIFPGLSVNAALALLPSLALEERNPAQEDQALKRLATWAGKFTSFTSIETSSVLLLEIAGSLRLFGGLDVLRRTLSDEIRQQGFATALAIAPTPLAATWLARAGRRVCIRDRKNLTGALSRLPLGSMDWPESVTESLRGMGIATIGDCLRLPRQGFARRFGASRLLQLDRALGRLPDPRQCYQTAVVFCREYDLSDEESDRELLLNASRELLLELERFLLNRQLVVQRVRFSFFHLQLPATHLTVGCARADRSIEHWCELLAIRFDRVRLPAPVIAIRLQGGRGQPLTATSGRLAFSSADRQRREPSISPLVERLSARIGDESVHGVMTVAEHRPQYAWRAAK
ncbi:MAG: DNA polymerase Y family protein, partial [Woeseiaceae bacterium]